MFQRLTRSSSRLLPLLIIPGLIIAGLMISDGHSIFQTAKQAHFVSRLTPEQATAIAVNRIETIDGGYRLNHHRHTAVFTNAGTQFTPKKGGPTWRWSLTAVQAGNAVVAQSSTVVPEWTAPNKVLYDRTAIIEQYLAKNRTIEQQFIIPEQVTQDNADLVITGQVDSDGEFETTDHGWLWRTNRGVVSLGDVTVYDATGIRLPAQMTAHDTETRITVDGSALAMATYPVTIDPEIGTNDFRISDVGPDGNADFGAFSPSIAYNSVEDEYLVVWRGDEIDGETEIYGQRLDAKTGAEIGTNDFRISDMGPDGIFNFRTFHPHIAYNSAANEYLVVWSGDDNTATLVEGEGEIYGQRLAANGAEIGVNDFRISDMGPDGDILFHTFNPLITYNSASNEYLVVWDGDDDIASLVDEENEVFGQRLAADGTELGSNDFRISDAGPVVIRISLPFLRA